MSVLQRIVLCSALLFTVSTSADPFAQCSEQFAAYLETLDAAEQDSESEREDIYSACPQQVEELESHAMSPLLARLPADELRLEDLRGLPRLEEWYASLTPNAPVDINSLSETLDNLELEPEDEKGLWERFLSWLQSLYREQAVDTPNWLENFSISEGALDAILYGSVGLIVLFAIFIIFYELRFGLSLRTSFKSEAWQVQAQQAAAHPQFEDLIKLPLAAQPGVLLQIVLHHLRSHGIWDSRASATHRDIATQSSQIKHAALLQEISVAAERSTFGNWLPSEAEIQPLVSAGRKICDDRSGGNS